MHKILSGAEKPTLPNLPTLSHLPLLPSHALTPTYSNSQNSPKLLSPFSSAKPRRLSLHAVFRFQLKQSKTAEVLPPEEELKGDIEDPILKEVSLWKEHSRVNNKEGRRLSKTSSFPVNDLHGSLDFAGSLIRSPRNFGNFEGLSPIRGSKHTEELTSENSPFAAEGLLKIQDHLVPIPENDKKPFQNNIKKPAKALYRKSSRINSDSSANSSFDRELVRLNLKQDYSEEESDASAIKSLEDLVSPKNGKRNHLDSAQILTSQETSTTRKVPLARLIRRKSCCCNECGNLSELEKKHQNLAGMCPREELNRFKDAILKKNLKERPKEASFHLDDSPKEEKEEFMVPPMTESPLGSKCLAIPSGAFGELESPLHSRMNSRMVSKTEADQEKVAHKKSPDSPGLARKFIPKSTTSGSNSKKSISSKNNSKASVEPVVRSPKTFVVKHVKEPSSQSSPSIKASLQIPSIKFGEKSGQASPSLLKIETTPSRHMDSRRLSSFFAYSIEENMAMHSEQQPRMTTIKNLYTVRNNREESRDSRNSKDSKEEAAAKFQQNLKNSTLSRFVNRKSSEADAFKTNKAADSLRLATLGDFEKSQTGFISPKVRTAMRKYSIQGIYTGSITSINSTPKLPSIQSSPTSKVPDNLLVPKKQSSSSKPKINIIITKDTDKIRVTPKDSPKGIIAGSLEVHTGGTPRKSSTSTLDTLSMPTIYNNNKQRKSWFGTMNMQLFTEKDQETVKTEVDDRNYEESEWRADKEKRRGEHMRKKKTSSKKKRSSSLEKVLKAYQQVQGKKKLAN